nr:hypothetical protein Iba_chr13dCG9270 [Ipomoea batatas]
MLSNLFSCYCLKNTSSLIKFCLRNDLFLYDFTLQQSFRCKAFGHRFQEMRDLQLDSKTRQCIFIGYRVLLKVALDIEPSCPAEIQIDVDEVQEKMFRMVILYRTIRVDTVDAGFGHVDDVVHQGTRSFSSQDSSVDPPSASTEMIKHGRRHVSSTFQTRYGGKGFSAQKKGVGAAMPQEFKSWKQELQQKQETVLISREKYIEDRFSRRFHMNEATTQGMADSCPHSREGRFGGLGFPPIVVNRPKFGPY